MYRNNFCLYRIDLYRNDFVSKRLVTVIMMLVDFVSSWFRFRYQSIVRLPRFLMEESEDDGCGKRPHVSSGHTPHKPKDKRRRSTGSVLVERRNAKRLSFPKSPTVKKSPLTRGKPLRSPLKELKSIKKARKPWVTMEDTALVQFVALHKDKQATEAEWPAMKAQVEYWTEAAIYIKQTASTEHLREASVVRQRVVNFMRQTFDKVEDAEACYGLDIDYYLLDAPTCATQSGPSLRLDEVLVSSIKSLTQQQLQELACKVLTSISDKKSVFLKLLTETQLSTAVREELIDSLLQPLSYQRKI